MTPEFINRLCKVTNEMIDLATFNSFTYEDIDQSAKRHDIVIAYNSKAHAIVLNQTTAAIKLTA